MVVMSSGLSWFGHGDCNFLTESLRHKLRVWSLKGVGCLPAREHVTKRCYRVALWDLEDPVVLDLGTY